MREEIWEDGTAEHLHSLAASLAEIAEDAFTEGAIKKAAAAVAKARGVKINKLYMPLRYAVTGTSVGCGMPTTLELVGKPRTLERISKALAM